MLAWVGAVVAIAAAPSAASAATGYVLSCSCENVVTVIDTATRSVVGTIPVGDEPSAIAVSPDGRAAYVAQRVEESIAVIDGATRTVAREIQLDDGDEPFALAVSPDGATLWVFVSDPGLSDVQLLRVDAAGGTITARADVAPLMSPFNAKVAISPDGTSLYALSWWSLFRFDLTAPGFPATDITPAGDDDPLAVAVAPDGTLYVPREDDTVLHLSATGGLLGSIALPPSAFAPVDIALDATGAYAWVVGLPELEATAIDLATEDTFPTTGIDDISFLIAVSPDGDGVYVGSMTDAILHVVDPQTRAQVGTVRLSEDPDATAVAIAFGPTVTPPPPPPPAALGGRPVVTAVSPAEGSTAGGEEVRITGANFATGAQVLFGDAPASAQRVVDFNTIVATAPPAANAGRVRVTVAAPDGLRSTEDVGYRYVEPPPASLTAPSTAPTRPACVVPDVRGLGLHRARTRLQAANCTVGYVSRLRGRRHQRVVRQSVRPGTQRPGGWGIALALRPRPAR